MLFDTGSVTQKCRICQEIKTLDQFNLRTYPGATTRFHGCKKCLSKRTYSNQKVAMERNPEKFKKSKRAIKLKRMFGMTAEQFEKIKAAQR